LTRHLDACSSADLADSCNQFPGEQNGNVKGRCWWYRCSWHQ
jgi:hypothetical protein